MEKQKAALANENENLGTTGIEEMQRAKRNEET
jgi:hypothetical protein